MLPSFTIDAHHHLWRYTRHEFDWISDDMARLRRDFLIPELEEQTAMNHIQHTILVQARPSVAENDFLLDAAAQSARIAGAVGWLPLCHSDLPELLERLAGERAFLGLRDMAQSEAPGYLEQPAIDRGLREVTARNLSFDLLVRRDQLLEATRLVDRHPMQRFVLDHAAKPNIRAGEREPWATHLRAFAHRDNVTCKLSGLVTEADWQNWTVGDLLPFLDVCVEAFGPGRLMAGSDWPVCLLASEASRWWAVLDEYFKEFTITERESIFGRTAHDFYQLHRSTGS